MEEEFIIYRKMVMHAEAGPDQVAECRRAFMAGGACIMSLVFQPETEAAIEARIKGLQKELLRTAETEAKTAMEAAVAGVAAGTSPENKEKLEHVLREALAALKKNQGPVQ